MQSHIVSIVSSNAARNSFAARTGLAFLLTAGCVAPGKRDGGGGSVLTEIPALTCQEGRTPETFVLAPVAALPTAAELGLPSEYVVTPPTYEYNVRFDACFDEASFRFDINRVVAPRRVQLQIRPSAFPVDPVLVDPPGFAEALGGDYTTLALDLSASGQLGMRGVTIAAESFAVVELKSFKRAVVGKLVAGDLIDHPLCRPLEKYTGKAVVALGTATMTIESCNFKAAGETTGIRIAKVLIEDTREGLTPEQRRVEFATPEELAKIDFRFHHHNACDGLSLVMEHLSIGLTKTDSGAQGPSDCAGFGVAPPRDEAGSDPNRARTRFRLQYAGGPWESGYLDCPSFVLGGVVCR